MASCIELAGRPSAGAQSGRNKVHPGAPFLVNVASTLRGLGAIISPATISIHYVSQLHAPLSNSITESCSGSSSNSLYSQFNPLTMVCVLALDAGIARGLASLSVAHTSTP